MRRALAVRMTIRLVEVIGCRREFASGSNEAQEAEGRKKKAVLRQGSGTGRATYGAPLAKEVKDAKTGTACPAPTGKKAARGVDCESR
jgi:hypothetical protein